MKVVRRRDFFSSGICQNPQLAPSLLKTVAPDNCARVSSTFGSGWSSRNTLWLRGLRTTHIRTVEVSFFRTTTIPAHHRVGLWTFEMMPSASIRASSSLTFLRSGRGTRLGAVRVNGLASGFREISYSSPKFPKPRKSIVDRGVVASSIREVHFSGDLTLSILETILS